jgi:SAM-dependent methyltransferase
VAARPTAAGDEALLSQATALRRFERWFAHAPIARAYAWLTSIPGALLLNTPAYKLHEELQLRPDNRVLDVGAGRGSLLKLLASHVAFDKPAVGIDTSRTLLQLNKVPEDQRVQGGPSSLPFADASFDVVTCAYVMHRLDDDAFLTLLREMKRVLTHGGIAVIWDFAPTRSATLNAWNRRVLSAKPGEVNLRTYTTLSAYALEAGFEWVNNAHLRPFLAPPIPRISLILGKAPVGWTTDVPAVNEAIKRMHLEPAGHTH